MGCDIHTFSEKLTSDGWVSVDITPFDYRVYGIFGFLADVRNYSQVPPLSLPRGLPDDISLLVQDVYGDGIDYHSASWLSVQELSEFDYDTMMEDRRVTRREGNIINGAAICEPGEGKQMTFREFLGDEFFNDLKKLQDAGVDRVVFWFDN
jgi:hypothetical protein